MLPKRLLPAALTIAATLTLAACGSSSSSSSSSNSSATTSASACTKESLKLQHDGQLTIATDSPAYSPYFIDNKPANGKGFESAVAYAIAQKLGFSTNEVKWTVEPFDSSYAPGPKSFDFDLNEISITKPRLNEVDFSAPYYTDPQGVIVPKGSKLASIKSLAELKDAKIGVQIGTTSLEATEQLIEPSQQPQVFNNSNDVVSAFKNKSVDAIVVDLATGFELTGEELTDGQIVGQFSAPGGDNWGALLGKGSSLTPCVTKAIESLRSEGALQKLTTRWMTSSVGVPQLG
ncbi:MAG TPA: ABC transporter substrate-binding protein [Solirubrobacteraceae bacterium]|jgi:polar amino acid transport system substrate-binding protein|nr:ABC transporter substrate-binding protein [Solirubrobacteraceae bacterium]